MIWIQADETLIFSTLCRLIADPVRIGAADTCRAGCLMRIDHDLMLSRLGDAIEIVIVHELTIVMLTPRDDIAHIAALHCLIAILVHEVVGLL